MKTRARTLWLALLTLACLSGMAWSAQGMKKRKPLPFEFGSVTLNTYSKQQGMPPVTFDHWVHRRSYTCRLCHVDIGFGMTAGSTKIRAVDNMKGYFCGTCHNGKMRHEGRPIFAACSREYSREDYKRCVKCHTLERSPDKEESFYSFADSMPKERFGNGIDWQKAEEAGLIRPVDQLEGVSGNRGGLKISDDFSLKAKVEGMPDIIFSHRRHTAWNGCEVCHPDLFLGIKKGATKYSMVELFEGKYCGVCHDKVAFPQSDCQRCHTRQVQS